MGLPSAAEAVYYPIPTASALHSGAALRAALGEHGVLFFRDQALTEAQQAVDQIAAQVPAAADYASTFLAMDEALDKLNEAWGKVAHLSSVADTPELRQAHNAMLPKISAFQAGIPLHEGLWRQLKAVAGGH